MPFATDAPLCKPGQKIIYGAARHEAVRVLCEVESDPREVTFHWQFNNTAESLEVVTFVNDGTMSTATYIPRTEFDYGTLLCWGTNIVGSQLDPCIYTIVPAGKLSSMMQGLNLRVVALRYVLGETDIMISFEVSQINTFESCVFRRVNIVSKGFS